MPYVKQNAVVDWRFKNGKDIKSNTKCVLSVDKDVGTLTLKVTELNDAGTYKCEASNKLGTVNTECTVEVQGKSRFVIYSCCIILIFVVIVIITMNTF